MKKFTALHLADLRLRRVDAQPEAICALFDDIAAYRDAGHVIDAIFFSGDLVARDACAGTTPAYVYEQFLRPVLQAASAPGTRFYLVPDQRAAGRARNSHFDGSGFSFFSAPVDAAGERRALYKNLHGVFHGHSEATSGASLMNALGVLYKSHPGSLYRADDRDDNDGRDGTTLAYALLEYEARPERSWTVALRKYDAGRFAVANLYLPDGKANARMDAQYVFATLLPRADAADGYIDGLLGMANFPASAVFDVASMARAFLIELAFYMYETGKTALEIDEMAHFATDHCAVANLGVAPASLVDSLCSNGLLLGADGLVVFQFDYFRTFFLAQRFETSIDLRHYSMPRPASEPASVATVATAASLASMPYLSRLAASGGILAEDNLLTLFSKQP